MFFFYSFNYHSFCLLSNLSWYKLAYKLFWNSIHFHFFSSQGLKKSAALARFLGICSKLSVKDGVPSTDRLDPGVRVEGVLFLGVPLGVNVGVLLPGVLWPGEGV